MSRNGSSHGTHSFYSYNGTSTTLRFKLNANGTASFNNAFTLPATDGSANQVLTTNGSGTVSWGSGSGLALSGGTMSGHIAMANNNITGVNQLEFNDPGEGIVFKSGSSGDMVLKVLDDSSDNILQYSGTGAIFDVVGLTRTDGLTSAGNVTITGGNTDGSGNAFVVNRGGNSQEQALRVENSGEVVVANNYLYCSKGSGTAFYVQGGAVFRGGIANDGGDLTLSDDTNITGVIKKGGTTIVDNSRNLTNMVTGTFSGNVQHAGLTMTSGTDIDQLKTVNVTATLSTSWQDTGIDGSDLQTGTYIVQVYVNDNGVGGQHYTEYYSGTMSWYQGNTNSTVTDEILLHRAGHAPNAGDFFLRTERTENADSHDLMLQMRGSTSNTGNSTYVFKFRRMI